MMERFFEEFQVLLNSGSPSGISMLAFINRSLRQFNLNDSYTAEEILSDAFIRGVESIESGKTIDSSLAWMRATAFNIIRERSRTQKRILQLEESWLGDLQNQTIDIDEQLIYQCEWVEVAFAMLSPEEKKLLMLKIWQNLSFREIAQWYHSQGFVDITEATLRKRKERTIKRLRKIYHSLELQSIIQNQFQKLLPSSDAIHYGRTTGRLNKETLTGWKLRISEYQRCVFDNNQQKQLVNPFFLPRKSMSSSRLFDRDFRGQECIYFICDTAANIILYVGDTTNKSKQMPSMYDCSRYIECYEDLNSEHGFKTTLKIAYWNDSQEIMNPNQDLTSTLIKEWNTPLNKENWLFD